MLVFSFHFRLIAWCICCILFSDRKNKSIRGFWLKIQIYFAGAHESNAHLKTKWMLADLAYSTFSHCFWKNRLDAKSCVCFMEFDLKYLMIKLVTQRETHETSSCDLLPERDFKNESCDMFSTHDVVAVSNIFQSRLPREDALFL